MSTQPFDVVICCTQKDYHKLPITIGAAMKNIVGYDSFYVITPTPIPHLSFDRIHYFTDKQVLDVDVQQWKFRPFWIYQQFIKLFQNVSANDYYVTLDSDIVVARPLAFFNETGKPRWYFCLDQHHKPYFIFQKKMFGFGKVYEKSFVADMNFFSRTMIREMLAKHNMTFETFLEKSRKIINKKCYLAEPELYGSYMAKYHPGFYDYKTVSSYFEGKRQESGSAPVWDALAMNELINSKKNEGFDMIAMHSWDG